MSRGKMNSRIFGLLSLMLMGRISSAARMDVFDRILESLQNVEELIRESSQPTLYLTTSIRQNEFDDLPEISASRNPVSRVDSPEMNYLREYLKRNSVRPVGRIWEPPRQPFDDSAKFFQRSQNNNERGEFTRSTRRPTFKILKIKPKIIAGPLFDSDSDNANSNVNSNVNDAKTGPSSVETMEKTPEIDDETLTSGARSLFRSRGKLGKREKHGNRNENTNTNINTNSLSMDRNEIDE